MAKLTSFLSAAVALCAFASGVTAQNATTPAPTPTVTAVRPACVPNDFTTKASEFKSLANLISFAISSNLITTMIPPTIEVNNTVVAPVPFKVLNLKFELTPTIKELKLNGVSTLLPKYVNTTSANSIKAAVDFNGTLALQGKFKVKIEQLDLKWYSICWTDAIHLPFTCPPAEFDVDVDFAIVKPGFVVDALLDVAGCAPGVPRTVCKDVTVSDLTIALIQQNLEPVLARLLHRFKSASVTGLQLGWDSITALDITIKQTGSLIDALLDQLVNFSVKEVNKKGDIYRTVVDVAQKIFTAILNNLISVSLAPQFGNSCYDA